MLDPGVDAGAMVWIRIAGLPAQMEALLKADGVLTAATGQFQHGPEEGKSWLSRSPMGPRLRSVAGKKAVGPSSARARGSALAAVAAQLSQPDFQGCQGIRLQAVVDPAAALPVCQEACFAKHLQVKGELDWEVEICGQITDASFPVRQSVDHLQANRLGRRFDICLD